MAQLSLMKYLSGIYRLDLDKTTKVHNAIIQSIYDLFIMASGDLDEMRLELCISTASGAWLDYWGEFFSVHRKAEESDYNYANRIIASVIQPKSTIPAIKDNIVSFLNTKYNTQYTREDVKITEPWMDVAKYSHKGKISHDARFFSHDYYTHAVIVISIPEDVTPDLIDLVKAVKAAGVKVIWSILNSYDIVSGFNNADDSWAAYRRQFQTRTYRNQYAGFVMSSPSGALSGPAGPGKVVYTTERETLHMYGADAKREKNRLKVTDEDYSIVGNRLTTSDGTLYTTSETIKNDRYRGHGLSGSRQIWCQNTSTYQWYAKILEKNTDDSIIITKKDLIGLIDFYETVEKFIVKEHEHNFIVSDNGFLDSDKKLSGGSEIERVITKYNKITQDVLDSLETLDKFLSMSYKGRLSTSSGTMFEYTAPEDTYKSLQAAILKFKEENLEYYNKVQPPILNGDRVQYLVERNKNWIWNTPTMTHRDFFELWEPFEEDEDVLTSVEEYIKPEMSEDYVPHKYDFKLNVALLSGVDFMSGIQKGTIPNPDYESPTKNQWTLATIKEFEDAYYKGYITFGDKYQPPIVVGRPLRWFPRRFGLWLFDSPVFQNGELEQIYYRQWDVTPTGRKAHEEPTLGEIMDLEENYNVEGFSIAREVQPGISVNSRPQVNCVGITPNKTSISVNEKLIGTKETIAFVLTPNNANDYVYFSSSNPDVASIDEDGVITYNKVGTCSIKVICGSASATIVVEITKTVTPEPAPEPDKIIKTNFTPDGTDFTLYRGSFDATKQTLYLEIELDNKTKANQNIVRFSAPNTGITQYAEKSINMIYPNLENISHIENDIDTSDNFSLASSPLSGSNLLSGSTYNETLVWDKHEYDSEEVINIDTSDNLALNESKISTGDGMLSGSEYEVDVVDTIFVDSNLAEFIITSSGVSDSMKRDLGTNTIKILMNANGYYINAVSLNEIEPSLSKQIKTVIDAITSSKYVIIDSTIGTSKSYATYKEVKIMQKLLSETQMKTASTV